LRVSNAKLVSKALLFRSRGKWRGWLKKNHDKKDEAFLFIYKRAPKNERFSNGDAVEEALCFGWIDGWFRPVDNDRWIIRYTPRRKGSSWSDYNIARAWKLLAEEKMTQAGKAKLPLEVVRVWKESRPEVLEVHPRNRTIRFSVEDMDYLAKVKRPAKTP
jgi:uncharacterized protein YdeI (YjbR/CyaY-like superfamily)